MNVNIKNENIKNTHNTNLKESEEFIHPHVKSNVKTLRKPVIKKL